MLVVIALILFLIFIALMMIGSMLDKRFADLLKVLSETPSEKPRCDPDADLYGQGRSRATRHTGPYR